MKAKLIILFLFSANLFAQIKFEKGYFIDSQNTKVECFIKNKDWIGLPSEIEFKLTKESKVETISLQNLNEFKIDETDHYYRKYKFLIDKDISAANDNFVEETTFLRIIVEGTATLLEYNQYRLYFYATEKGSVKQLKYKRYVDSESKVREDNSFRKELFDNLKCTNITFENTLKLEPEKRDLAEFFVTYNKCRNSDYSNYNSYKTKTEFNFKALVGISSYSIVSELSFLNYGSRSLNYKSSSTNFVVGFETELILPFNNNVWSVFLAPNYQYHSQDVYDEVVNFSGYNGKILINDRYSYVDLPIGIRKYFYLDKNSKIFIDGSYSFLLFTNKNEKRTFEPDIDYSVPLVVVNTTNSSMAFRIGFGYSYDNQYYFSINYNPIKELPQSSVKSFTFLVSYKLF